MQVGPLEVTDAPKYLHYFGNESNESLLEAYGIVASGQQIDQLRPKAMS